MAPTKTTVRKTTAKKSPVKKTVTGKPVGTKATNADLMRYLEWDLYAVEIENGHKIIHALSYAYNAEIPKNTPYRIVEYTYAYVDPKKLRALGYGYYNEVTAENTQYIDDVNRAGVLKYLKEISKYPHLPMTQVNDRTPTGYYIQKTF